MNKRLRKKLRKGEFTEYGFEVFALARCYSYKQEIGLCYQVLDFLSSMGLECGGAIGRKIQIYVSKYKGTCTEEHRQKLQDFLADKTYKLKILPLSNCWYVSQKEMNASDIECKEFFDLPKLPKATPTLSGNDANRLIDDLSKEECDQEEFHLRSEIARNRRKEMMREK